MQNRIEIVLVTEKKFMYIRKKNLFIFQAILHLPASVILFSILLLHGVPTASGQQFSTPFTVSAVPSRLVTAPSANISLICHSSHKPILCLWKTPYGHIYTLSEGVFAEGGRLRHLSGRGSSSACGLEIVGVEGRDDGRWECEVGAVIREDFKTKTDDILLDVQGRKNEANIYLKRVKDLRTYVYSTAV